MYYFKLFASLFAVTTKTSIFFQSTKFLVPAKAKFLFLICTCSIKLITNYISLKTSVIYYMNKAIFYSMLLYM